MWLSTTFNSTCSKLPGQIPFQPHDMHQLQWHADENRGSS